MVEEKSIGMEVRELSILLKRRVENVKIKHNARGIHMWALSFFYRHRSCDIFQRDFEKSFSIRRSTATNMLKLMEKNGFIIRHSVHEDARLKKIVLTEKALMLYDSVEKEMQSFSEQLAKGLSQKEIDAFIATIQKIKKNLE